jgi:hypothetical protein
MTALAHASPVVLAVSPTAQSMSASASTQIAVTFDVAMDPLTMNSANILVFGHWSGVAAGQFQMENGNTRMRFVPARPFSSGEQVLVSMSKNVRSQTGQTMIHGYAWSFWIKPSAGNLNLQEAARITTRRSGEGHIQTYGAYAGDFNGDGRSDFAVPNELSNDVRMFLNSGNGTYSSFVVYPLPNGDEPSTNDGADFNGDGKLDFAVGNGGTDSVCVMLGNGSGGFSSVRNYGAASGVRGLSVMDLDGDGDMDIVTANRAGDNLTILKNNGEGTFAPRVVVEANGIQETACAAADANGDGILDLFVGAYGSNEIILMLGDGNGGLVFSQKVSAGGKPWKIKAGDVNGDGNVDVVSANSVNNNAAVILGDGQGHLLPAVTYPVGSFPLSIDLGDIDGDGDLDLVTSNYSGASWSVYENNGNGQFINRRTLPASRAGSCSTLHDRDNDGDLDMTGIDEEDDLIFLFENRPPTSVRETELPTQFTLEQNYPNPFNPSTRIQFTIPVGTYGFTSLRVYDLLGREVATLVDGVLEPGFKTVQFDGSGLSSGMYFYRLSVSPSARRDLVPTSQDGQSSAFTETRKMLLMR